MTINDIKNTFKLNQKVPIKYYNNKKIHNTSLIFRNFELTISKKYPHYDDSSKGYEAFGGMVVCQLNLRSSLSMMIIMN